MDILLYAFTFKSYIDVKLMTLLVELGQLRTLMSKQRKNFVGYVQAYSNAVLLQKSILLKNQTMEIEAAGIKPDESNTGAQIPDLQACLLQKYEFLQLFNQQLIQINGLHNRINSNNSVLNLKEYFNHIIDNPNIQIDDSTYISNKLSSVYYSREIIDALELLLSDAQLSRIPILNDIVGNIEIYLKNLLKNSLESGQWSDVIERVKSLNSCLEHPKNHGRFPTLQKLTSSIDNFYAFGKKLESLKRFDHMINMNTSIETLDLYKIAYSIEDLFEENSMLRELSSFRYCKQLAIIYIQIFTVHKLSLSEVAKFVDEIFERKLKEFDKNFTEVSYQLRNFFLDKTQSKLRQNMNFYFSHTKMFGVSLEESLSIGQILELPVFADIKNSLVFDEFKKHAIYLSNQEFSLIASNFNESLESFTNFKTKILDNFSKVYHINYELYRMLHDEHLDLNSLNYSACLKLFNFLIGYEYLICYFAFSKRLQHSIKGFILYDFSSLLYLIFDIIIQKVQSISLVSKEEGLEIKMTNIYFFESLLRLYSLYMDKEENFSDSTTDIQSRLNEVMLLLSTNIDLDSFFYIFMRALLFNPNSKILLKTLHLLLKGQLNTRSMELSDFLFKQIKINDNVETLSFNYEHIPKNSIVYLTSAHEKSIWEILLLILPTLKITEIHSFTDIAEMILEFNQLPYLRTIHDTFVSNLTTILDQLESSNNDVQAVESEKNLDHLFKVLLSVRACIHFANFKSYGLSKKISEIFIRIHKWVESNFSIPSPMADKIMNIKLTNIDILLLLSDSNIGLRSFLDQPDETKTILEDIPIESHIKRIFELIQQDNYSISLVSVSPIELQSKIKLLEIFYNFMSNNLGKNLLLQLIDTKGIVFGFTKLFSEENIALIRSKSFSDSSIYGLLFEYMHCFVKVVNLFFKIKTTAEAKCILSTFGLPLNPETKIESKDSEYEYHFSKIKKTIKSISNFFEALLTTQHLFPYIEISYVFQGLKLIKSQLSKKKKKFQGLEKKVKFEFKEIMPDELEQRISTAGAYANSSQYKRSKLTKSFESFNLSNLCKDIIAMTKNESFAKSFKVKTYKVNLDFVTPTLPLNCKMNLRALHPALKVIKNKILNLIPIFKDLGEQNTFQIPQIQVSKVGQTNLYKPEDKMRNLNRDQLQNNLSGNASYLIFNTKKLKEDTSHKQASHKLHRTNTHLPHSDAHISPHHGTSLGMNIQNMISQEDMQAISNTGGVVNKMIKTATGMGVKHMMQNFNPLDPNDINNPMNKLLNSLPFKTNLMNMPLNNPNPNQFASNIIDRLQTSQRHTEDSKQNTSEIDLKKALGEPFQPNLPKTSQSLLSTLGGTKSITPMNLPMYQQPYNPALNTSIGGQMIPDQGLENFALGKRPMMNYPMPTMTPQNNPSFNMNMPFIPGQPFANPIHQMQMMSQMFMYPGQGMMPQNPNFSDVGNMKRDQTNVNTNLPNELRGDISDPNQSDKNRVMPNPQLLSQLSGMPSEMMFPPNMVNPHLAYQTMIPPNRIPNMMDKTQQLYPNMSNIQAQHQAVQGYLPQQLPISPNAQYGMPPHQSMNPQAQKYGGFPVIPTLFESPYSPHTQNMPLMTPPHMHTKSPHHHNQSPYSNPIGRTMEDSCEFSDNQFSDDEELRGNENRNYTAYATQHQQSNHTFKQNIIEPVNQAENETKSFLQQLAKTPGARFLTKQP